METNSSEPLKGDMSTQLVDKSNTQCPLAWYPTLTVKTEATNCDTFLD